MIGGAIMVRSTDLARSTSSEGSLQSARQIDISIAGPCRQELSETWLSFVVDCALQVALPPGAAVQVSLLVADDATVRELNREFRGLDEVTDVLSFSPSHAGRWEGEADVPEGRYLADWESEAEPFVLPPDELPMFGDIIISHPQAQRQALARSKPISREIARLIVHGVVHLAGYDHLEPAEAVRMRARERAALSAVFQAGT